MAKTSDSAVPVIWLIAAHDQLENALHQAGEFVGKSEADQERLLKSEMDRLDDLLRRTFEDAQAIVVLDRLGGFSCRSDRHVLRVEIKRRQEEDGGQEKTEARMVKIGRCTELCKELIGRRTCERSANARGRTLLRVRMGVCPRGFRTPRDCPDAPTDALSTIIYQDAYHTLRAGRVVSLEKAFLNCVRWGTPSPQSVLGVLDQVYQELQNHCYERAPAVRPLGVWRSILDGLEDRLKKGLDRWKDGTSVREDGTSDPSGCRRQARELLRKDLFPFVDLLDFHARAFHQLHYQPELRFGRAHGDLHGRNIVVGLVNGEARWPAVFDFEDMGVNNFVAWDFVKLEMELKIRALPFAFSCTPEDFVAKVWDFETRLNLATEERNARLFDSWQDDEAHCWKGIESCLHTLLLGLRRRAKRYLQMQGPPRTYRWLHEYYFFLACYGIYAGKFQTYKAEEWLAAYLGASCAATRYTWGVECVYLTKDDGKARAQQRLNNARWTMGRPTAMSAGGPPASPGMPASPPSYDAEDPRSRWDVRLEEMRTLARSRDEQSIKQAVSGLEELKQRVPTAAEIISELAFALLELAELAGNRDHYRRAVEELTDFEERQKGFYSRDVEVLCRWGRLWKDCGDRALQNQTAAQHQGQSPAGTSATMPTSVREQPRGQSQGDTPATTLAAAPAPFQLSPAQWYHVSAAYYRRAYEASEDYYPGINLATLTFLISSLDVSPTTRQQSENSVREYRNLAAEVKERLEDDERVKNAKQRKRTIRPGEAIGEPPDEPEDAHWRLASLGEACLLLGDPAAYEHYTKAWNHKNTTPQARDSIQKQAYRIMRQQKSRKQKEIHARLHELFEGRRATARTAPKIQRSRPQAALPAGRRRRSTRATPVRRKRR
jgi:hypothetical protein